MCSPHVFHLSLHLFNILPEKPTAAVLVRVSFFFCFSFFSTFVTARNQSGELMLRLDKLHFLSETMPQTAGFSASNSHFCLHD